MSKLSLLVRFALEWGHLSLQSWPPASERVFLRAAYRAYLGREPDDEGLRYYHQALQRETTTRRGILHSIRHSSEFKQRHGIAISPLDALHQSRVGLVVHCLPPAEVIVDLGGGAGGHRGGALVAMGYPHCPREITIVDLPPTGESVAAETVAAPATGDGIRVRYLYRSMTDLSPIPDASVDLVWSGESIEHVSEDEADAVCREAYRVLKPGGSLCLDTPNASLARLHSPGAFLHPEHQKEYYVAELKSKLERCGFTVVDSRGICPMPRSLKSGVFSAEEMVQSIGLSANPEEGYLFYLRGVKPPAFGMKMPRSDA